MPSSHQWRHQWGEPQRATCYLLTPSSPTLVTTTAVASSDVPRRTFLIVTVTLPLRYCYVAHLLDRHRLKLVVVRGGRAVRVNVVNLRMPPRITAYHRIIIMPIASSCQSHHHANRIIMRIKPGEEQAVPQEHVRRSRRVHPVCVRSGFGRFRWSSAGFRLFSDGVDGFRLVSDGFGRFRTSSGATPASARERRRHSDKPAPSGCGVVIWCASQVAA